MHQHNVEATNQWRDNKATDKIVELRDGQLLVTTDGIRRSLSVPHLKISFHRSGKGLTLYNGFALPTPGFKSLVHSSHSVLFLTDGDQEVRIGVQGEELLEFEHHQRIESDLDLNLSIQQIRDLRDALIIEGVDAPKPPRKKGSFSGSYTFTLEKYDPSEFGGSQLKSTIFSILVVFASLFAAYWILENGYFELWMMIYEEGDFLLAAAILLLVLLIIAVVTKVVFWIHDRLDGLHLDSEYQLIIEDGTARFSHLKDGEIASATIEDMIMTPCEIKISPVSSRGARSMMRTSVIRSDNDIKRRLPALQVQFPDGPAFRISSKHGTLIWKGTPRIISESQVDFELDHLTYFVLFKLLRLLDQVKTT